MNRKRILWPTLVGLTALACNVGSWRVVLTAESQHANPIVAIDFANSLNGWASSFDRILSSTDGGLTWNTVLVEEGAVFQDLTATGSHGVWVFGSRPTPQGIRGAVWATNGAVPRWRSRTTYVASPLLAGAACGSGTGFAVGGEQVLRTLDGGSTWTGSYDGEAGDSFLDVHCDRAEEVWVVGANGVALHSEDRGGSWRRQILVGPDALLSHVHFSGVRGWIVGGQGFVLGTRDSGQTWEAIAMRSEEALYGVTVEGRQGWIVGAKGALFHSTDGGDSWRRAESPVDVDLLAVDMIDENLNWIGAAQGTILRRAAGQ